MTAEAAALESANGCDNVDAVVRVDSSPGRWSGSGVSTAAGEMLIDPPDGGPSDVVGTARPAAFRGTAARSG